MAYYLKHYFDPEFRHEKLGPRFMADGAQTPYYLGYVQNVVAGQVLAELINLDEHPEFTQCDPRYVYSEPVFPCGPNCSPHPENASRIIATENGYCFYYDGVITVKKLLNIRRDVSFHTGNVLFVGDVVAHGDINPGFAVQGRNVLVKGMVEASHITASGDVACERGVKGGDQTVIYSTGNVKLRFCENAKIIAHGNVEIDGDCVHSLLYVGGSLLIKGRLQGGRVVNRKLVFVQEQIGGQGASTEIIMGYDPLDYHRLITLEKDLKTLREHEITFEEMLRNEPQLREIMQCKLELLTKKITLKRRERQQVWERFGNDEKSLTTCQVICPGIIQPGLDLSFGESFRSVSRAMKAAAFRLSGYEIRADRAPLAV